MFTVALFCNFLCAFIDFLFIFINFVSALQLDYQQLQVLPFSLVYLFPYFQKYSFLFSVIDIVNYDHNGIDINSIRKSILCSHYCINKTTVNIRGPQQQWVYKLFLSIFCICPVWSGDL